MTTTITLIEENALKILSIFKQKNLRPPAVLHYSGLFDDARGLGLELKAFREALTWLTDRNYLEIPRMPMDSFFITQKGLDKSASHS